MSQLQKAKLIPDDNVPTIQFMFNPTELTFDMTMEIADNPGSRDEESGKSKTSFSNINPVTLTISNIVFDTYESNKNVVTEYIEALEKAVQFAPGTQHPPIYSFVWGNKVFLRRCFLEQLNYKLTMFLPDGTPVRAHIDSLTLKEADESFPMMNPSSAGAGGGNSSQQVPSQLRSQDSIESRMNRIWANSPNRPARSNSW